MTGDPDGAAGEPDGAAGEPAVERFTPALTEAEFAVAVRERLRPTGAGVSLADAEVVVSGGRGVGSAEGFAVALE
ncbi:MAG: hypothetical protein ABSG43_29980 [Solirubrobacteraceae bacterium]